MLSKLQEAIALFVKNLGLFSQIILTVWLPGSLLIVFLRYFVIPITAGEDQMTMFVQEIRISSFLESLVSPLYGGAIISALAKIKQLEVPTYQQVMRHAASRSLKLFATRFSTSLMIFLGLLALIVPGIILILRYYFIDQIVVLENINGNNARQRSRRLTKGRKGQIFWASLVAWIGTLVTVIALSIVFQTLILEQINLGQGFNFIFDVAFECLSKVIFGFLYVVSFVFYWDSRRVDYYSQSSEADF